jgi:hypothetical protein
MSPLARTWLRRIALGLPLGVAPVAAPLVLSLAACTCPDHTQTFPIRGEQAATILGADGLATVEGCRAVCDSITHRSDAGVTDGASPDGGVLVRPEFGQAIGCHVISESAQLEVRCEYHSACLGGRRSLGLDESPARVVSTAGAWLARMAWMEAAAVDAFVDLASDLKAHGAPEALVREALRAAADEQRHARMVARLAERRGVTPPAPRRGPHARPSLLDLARDNAVEGGVREAFGALLAAYQAEHAPDEDVRRVMRAIARDEARHGLLSARIDDWARTQVDGAALDDARVEAARAMGRALGDEHDEALAAALGLPSIEIQRTLVAALA